MEDNPIKVKGKKLTVKYPKIKKASRKYKAKQYLSIKKAKGRLSFKKVKGSKYFKVNKKAGKLTIKKGLKKGSYIIKVKVTAKGNENYLPGSKTVKVKILVK